MRQGASRASRSTSRSTVIFAIRRHVVSLPPVIVIIPLGGLVQLGLARDVDRLLRVAGRDQRPHAGEGARRARSGPSVVPKNVVDRVEQVVDVLARTGSTCSSGALVVVVGRADQRVPEPRQREDRAPAAGRDDRAADAAAGPRGASVMWVPRLGRMRGSSASSCSSCGRSSVGPHAGGVDDVRRRAPRTRSPLSRVAHAARRARARRRSSRPVDVERGWRTPRRSARPRRAPSARGATSSVWQS